jgi:hypothetical protein
MGSSEHSSVPNKIAFANHVMNLSLGVWEAVEKHSEPLLNPRQPCRHPRRSRMIDAIFGETSQQSIQISPVEDFRYISTNEGLILICWHDASIDVLIA